jgi:hypothetical protein
MPSNNKKEKSVSFRDAPSSGSKSRQRSDSGIAQDYDEQLSNVDALREALKAANDKVNLYRAKCHALDQEVTSKNKKLLDFEAKFKVQYQVEDDLQRSLNDYKKRCKEMDNENSYLKQEVSRLRQNHVIYVSQAGDGSASRGGDPSAASSSAAYQYRDSDARSPRQTDPQEDAGRLRERFSRNNTNADPPKTSSGTGHRHRSRRSSVSGRPYVEEYGGGGRPQSVSSGRSFDRVAIATYDTPQMASTPRTMPAYQYPADTAQPGYAEDGQYHAYPIERLK